MNDAARPPLRDRPSRLFIETTARCNLHCAMCVKQAGGVELAEGDLPPDLFDALRPALPGLDALILSGVGEPLLHPGLEEMTAAARRDMGDGDGAGWIGFQSNGLLLDDARARSLAEAGVDKVCLSLDAVSPDTLGHIRGGATLADLERALAALGKARTIRPVQVGIEFVALRDNVAELPEVLRWAAARKVDFALVTQCLPYDPALAARTAYDANTDRAVGFFAPWKTRAAEQGIDLDRYYAVLWNYTKSAEEQRIVDFVERMKKEASEREIFLNVQEILRRDESWLGEVETIFADARAVAARTGLDLTLPEVIPRGDRRCDFVEEGGAFVAWDGKVHPCYFLWHGYRCFVNGREKHINPRVFGDLNKTGLLDIWNESGYREFRESVTRYDYPFCSDCNLGKCCDYIQAEEFEQDCYINYEPCGDCLWCKGVFHCLS